MDAAWRSFGSSSGRVRRFEWEFLFLVGLVAFVYGSRPTDLHLRGEETRRAEVAVEMLQTGDWIVPRQQGEIYISRPPLANWCIAAAGYLRGGVDTVAARLPSIAAVLITTLMIYGLGRAEVGRFGAFTAAVAFATMVQVMQIGRTAETEAVFTAILSASLFVWFHGYRRGWSPWTLWGVGYTLAGLAALAKGPQGPPYFIGPAVLFLLYKRDWKTLFAPGHFAGVAVMLTVIGAWQIPYIVSAGPENALGVWMKLAKNNFGDENEASLTLHMLSYPFEVLACMLPWSLGLIPLLSSKLRSSLGSRQDVVTFHALAMLVTFPTVWLAVHAVPRYFMPLYPSAALVIGVVADRLLTAKPAGWVAAWPRLSWRATGVFAAGTAVACVAIIAGADSLLPPEAVVPGGVYVGLLVAASTLAAVVCFDAGRRLPRACPPACLGLFLGAAFLAVALEVRVAKQADAAAAVAELDAALPDGATLTSYGRLHHAFVYHHNRVRDSLVTLTADVGEEAQLADAGRFLAWQKDAPPPALPFPFRVVREVVIDREKPGRNNDNVKVIVAERLPAVASASAVGQN